jgi:hypothetical protein
MKMFLFHMRKSDPQGLAHLLDQKAVLRGITWLNQNAPHGWFRNLFQPLPNGNSMFRARMRSNDESVLALSYEHCGQFTDSTGHVAEYKISKHFNLSEKKLQLLGLRAKKWHASVLYWPELSMAGITQKFPYHVETTSLMLGNAWEEGIRNYGFNSQPRRHFTSEEITRLKNIKYYGVRHYGFHVWLTKFFGGLGYKSLT